jgi:hypothetical protein
MCVGKSRDVEYPCDQNIKKDKYIRRHHQIGQRKFLFEANVQHEFENDKKISQHLTCV